MGCVRNKQVTGKSPLEFVMTAQYEPFRSSMTGSANQNQLLEWFVAGT